jgi:hypothetical protein
MWTGIFAIVAISLILLFVWSRARFRSWPLLIAAAAWGLSALYELWFDNFYDPQHKFDIRIDLGLAIVISFFATLFAAAWSIRRR